MECFSDYIRNALSHPKKFKKFQNFEKSSPKSCLNTQDKLSNVNFVCRNFRIFRMDLDNQFLTFKILKKNLMRLTIRKIPLNISRLFRHS